MSLKLRKLLPIIVLLSLLFAAYIVTSNPPSAKRGQPSTTPQISVEVAKLIRKDLPIGIDSYGTIKPRTQSVLLPQVWIKEIYSLKLK